MGMIQLHTEITDISGGSAEVLIVGTDYAGIQCIIDAQQVEWPIHARTWRALMDASRRWLVEAVADRD